MTHAICIYTVAQRKLKKLRQRAIIPSHNLYKQGEKHSPNRNIYYLRRDFVVFDDTCGHLQFQLSNSSKIILQKPPYKNTPLRKKTKYKRLISLPVTLNVIFFADYQFQPTKVYNSILILLFSQIYQPKSK